MTYNTEHAEIRSEDIAAVKARHEEVWQQVCVEVARISALLAVPLRNGEQAWDRASAVVPLPFEEAALDDPTTAPVWAIGTYEPADRTVWL